ncbi:hypothetical protein [Pseudobacillus wudalianchiensis]|uniref:Uncharacterized protein n=1 Tax=Pseudobacillus wudalianchiensis TaxID=1743143 RepID=A0A1B9AML7_9BACI|nr:hypothetical protein [Bacillus wudalianchiensis]OCA85099.1 hypothetical protein A8F95_10440 [Bacillus wudalianchiensis]
MKKMMMSFCIATFMLPACSNEGEKRNSGAIKEKEQPVQRKETAQQGKESQVQEEWTSLPEYEEIMKHIHDQEYLFETVTDNENKRILLLKNKNGEKQYKTVFIKQDNRLKVIKINGGGQVFNGRIS